MLHLLVALVSVANSVKATELQDLEQLLEKFERAAVVLQNNDGETVVAVNADKPMVPASTQKLLTGFLALGQWGEDYRATTEFYYNESTSSLRVIGKGDPFLVSEEIDLLAKELAVRLDGATIASIQVDSSHFKHQPGLPWQGKTDNPYDAIPSALAANFNTMNLAVRNGRPVSNEEQTPLTRLAWQWSLQQPGLAKTGEVDKQSGLPLLTPEEENIGRINTGQDIAFAARYFGELLATFLWRHDARFVNESGEVVQSTAKTGTHIPINMLAKTVSIVQENPETGRSKIADGNRIQVLDDHGPTLYTHQNSRSLSTIVAGMLKYSTNFIANNLALMLVAEGDGKAVDFDGFRSFAEKSVAERFGWQDMLVDEGAGLSLANRLSGSQLVQLVEAYGPWQELLPVYKEFEFGRTVLAKTGSLQGVSTLAGIIESGPGENYRFAILLQDDSITDSKDRDSVLQLLIRLVR